jgi:hydrogenase maturation protein HypF
MAFIENLPLPGSALAIKKPYRTAIGYLLALGIDSDLDLPIFKQVDRGEIDIIRSQIEKGINTPLTSSMGRLFDAVSALAGVRGVIEYEAQAAIDMEMLALDAEGETGHYPFSTIDNDGAIIIKIHDLLTAIIDDLHGGKSKAVIAARFHNTIAQMIAEVCQLISAKTDIKKAALSGGVFQNRLLVRKTIPLLESAGLEVYTHRQVPCNDGGISLGQVVIAHHREEQGL